MLVGISVSGDNWPFKEGVELAGPAMWMAFRDGWSQIWPSGNNLNADGFCGRNDGLAKTF
jgi:hypothetical protein